MNIPQRYIARAVTVNADDRRLIIDWLDGHQSRFPFIWLRHSLFFPVLGRSDQADDGVYLSLESANAAMIESVSSSDSEVVIHWRHDQSVTRHELAYLRDNCVSKVARQERQAVPQRWSVDNARAFHWFKAADLEDPEMRLEIFLHLRDFGIVLIKNVSCVPGTVENMATYFGPVRQNHFGGLFDIRSLPQDLEGTGGGIGATASNAQAPHMDDGWRHSPIGISLYHCLKPDPSGGGVSFFIDGVAAAEDFRIQNPEAFQILNSTPVIIAAERNPQERFRTRARLIATDSEGVVRGIRVTDRTFPALDLPEQRIEPVYEALREFDQMLYNREREFEHMFQPGDMAIFDNHRVLHARRSFDASVGERWFQQLSVDREEFHNMFKQLAESQNRFDLSRWEQDAGVLSQDCMKCNMTI